MYIDLEHLLVLASIVVFGGLTWEWFEEKVAPIFDYLFDFFDGVLFGIPSLLLAIIGFFVFALYAGLCGLPGLLLAELL